MHDIRRTHRTITFLAGTYLGLSVLTVGVVVLLRDHPAQVNDTVWVRSVIVALSALLTTRFAVQSARGRPRSLLRLRIISVVMPVAIVVIISLPGLIPAWLRIEQAACGVVLVAIAVLAFGSAREVTRSRA